MRVGSLQSATLQSAHPQLAAWPGPVPDHCPLDRRRVLRARRSEASYVPMMRRPARSGRRWRCDYLLAHLTRLIFGKVIETSTPANHRIWLAIKNI
jgi:hypothetical protein